MSSYLAKLTLQGDIGTRKSSILLQFVDRRFRDNYDPTIGVEFGCRTIEVDQVAWKLQVWDTPALRNSSYRGSAGGLAVYSVSSRKSFDHVAQVLQDIRTESPESCYVLVGNRIDGDRQVSKEEGQRLADELGVPFMELSARNREQVDLPFFLICRLLNDKINSGEVEVSDTSGIRRYK